jgi:hypothetical protein
MQNKHIFEYAVIRLVPKVEREEFINIGVIMYCKKLKYIAAKFTDNKHRIEAFASSIDWNEIQNHMESYTRIAHGLPNSGPIGLLDAGSRFRWLTATRSTIIQSSKIHPGYCENENTGNKIEKLFSEFVE